jgi:phospholipid transport system substrate-binding protein
MTKKRIFISTVASLLFISATLSQAFAAEGPTAFLKSKDKKLKPLLANADKNKKKILKIIGGMMDFDTLCKDSLGKHWEPRTDAERKDFADTLRALIEKNLIRRLKDSKDHAITYGKETVSGDKGSVVTVVKAGTGPRADETEIVYKMKKKGASWIVTDMVTDGISLVSNYRDQFNSHINKDGWAGLMKRMKDKLAEKDPPAAGKK